MHQPTFASVEFEQKKRKTRRELFLERIDGLVPWDELEGRIEPHYPKAGRGRRPYPLAVMLRIHCVQLCYNLSGPAMEDLLYEAESVRLRRLLEPGSAAARAEREKASLRAQVEHPFLAVKRRFGYDKVRYRGLAKNRERLALLLGLTNLLRAEPQLA